MAIEIDVEPYLRLYCELKDGAIISLSSRCVLRQRPRKVLVDQNGDVDWDLIRRYVFQLQIPHLHF